MNHQIMVSNIGTVYDGDNKNDALKALGEYYHQSVSSYGRAADETVTWFINGEPVWDYPGNGVELYEIADYGVEHSQYFQGHGCSYTDYDFAGTGCGQDVIEALDDVLECIASSNCGPATDALIACIEADPDWEKARANREAYSVYDTLKRNGELTDDGDVPEMCELYYYLGVRYNLV